MNWVRSRRRLRAVRSVSHNRLIGESPLATVRCQLPTFTEPPRNRGSRPKGELPYEPLSGNSRPEATLTCEWSLNPYLRFFLASATPGMLLFAL